MIDVKMMTITRMIMVLMLTSVSTLHHMSMIYVLWLWIQRVLLMHLQTGIHINSKVLVLLQITLVVIISRIRMGLYVMLLSTMLTRVIITFKYLPFDLGIESDHRGIFVDLRLTQVKLRNNK